MTSGENAGTAGTPTVAATPQPAGRPDPDGAAGTPRPSPAELCQDSDDLLTSRRGLAATPGENVAPEPSAQLAEAGVPFSTPPFDGGDAAATPFSSAATASTVVEAPEVAAPDVPEAEAPAPQAEASATLAESGAPVEASALTEGRAAAVEPAEVAPPESPHAEASLPEASTAAEREAAASAEQPEPGPAPADGAPHEASAEEAPQNWGAGGGPVPSQPGANDVAKRVGGAAPVDSAPHMPEVVAATAAAPEVLVAAALLGDEVAPAAPPDSPFASLPIPADVEQAAIAASFVAWLPSDPETDVETPATVLSADVAEPATAPEAVPAADDAPTMGVPLLTALGLTDDTAGVHTNGHAAPHSPVLDLAALPALPASVHEQETREVAAETSTAAEPTPTPDPVEENAAIIAAMLQPAEPAGSVALAEAPLSVVTLPSGSETADAVIELPRADTLSIEAEPAALAAPPAEPPLEPPAPPAGSTPPPPPASPAPEEAEEEGATMTIIEHLEELRKRITIAAISIVVGAVVAWFFVPHFVNLLETDVRSLGFKFVNLSPLGPLGLNIKLAFVGGLILASPVVFYEIWAFVAPGLTRRERHYALPFSFIGGALFALGSATAIVIIPLALRFLVSFFPVFDLEQLLDINQYIMFITLIAVIFGITFELPIFMVGFSLVGIVNSRFFIQKFRFALFIMYGVAMVITPGADFISPLVLGTFLVALYWLGVLLIRFIGR